MPCCNGWLNSPCICAPLRQAGGHASCARVNAIAHGKWERRESCIAGGTKRPMILRMTDASGADSTRKLPSNHGRKADAYGRWLQSEAGTNPLACLL
jgi:hypothetical protein